MMRSAQASRLALGLVVLMAGSMSIADEKPGIEAKVAFDRLKTLAGEWKRTSVKEPDPTCQVGNIVYKVTAAGSVVVETFGPGSPMEMVSVYHLDGGELLMTHYCAAGNQPRLKLDRAKSTPDHLVFGFDGGTNLNPAEDMHVHAGEITFLPGGKVEAEWVAFEGGKKAMASKFGLSRP